MTKGTILISGSLAQRPGVGGHAWVFLQYLLGFKRLGFEVLFLDWLNDKMCVDRAGQTCTAEDSWNLDYLSCVMEEAGLRQSWSLDYNNGRQTFGLSRPKVLEKAGDALFILNVMGFLTDSEILERVRHRIFLDVDPGFGQMWQDRELATVFSGHDTYLTIGENIGHPDCAIPSCSLPWVTTPQPVVLDRWPVQNSTQDAPFTSIVTWRGPFAPVEYHGRTYGLRVHEFRKFAALPRLCSQRFDLALDIDPADKKDISLLSENGWRLLNPRGVANTPGDYQTFIQQSKAELMIAKNMYVDTHSGWISDRTLCYLASGKPVVAQDTGFSRNYPTGEGFLKFQTLDEAVSAVEEVSANYQRHTRAARDMAHEFFNSDKVLTRLLQKTLN